MIGSPCLPWLLSTMLATLVLAGEDVGGLIRQLGSDDIGDRERAEDTLAEMGEAAETPLLQALDGADAETRTRIQSALVRIDVAKSRRIDLVPVHQVCVGGGEVHSIAWSPDGKILASGGDRGDVVLWDVGRREAVVSFTAGDHWIQDLSFRPDGAQLSIDSRDVVLWDVRERKDVARYRGDGGNWSPDGLRFVHWMEKKRLVIRNAATLDEEAAPAVDADLRHVGYRPDGRLVGWVHSDGELEERDVRTGEALSSCTIEFEERLEELSWTPDGVPILLLSGRGRRRVRWSDVDIRLPETPFAAQASPDGKRIAVAGRGGDIHVWNRDGSAIGVWKAHTGAVPCLAWSPDGGLLASAGNDGDVRVWRDGESFVLRGHLGRAESYAFTRDGAWMIAVGEEGVVVRLDGGEPRKFPVSGAVAPGPNGAEMYVANGARIRLLDLSSGSTTSEWEVPLLQHPERLDPSPDGTRLVISNRFSGAALWRPGSPPTPVGRGYGTTLDVAWHPAGDRVTIATVSGHHGEFGELGVYDLEGRALLDVEQFGLFHPEYVCRATCFDTAGKMLLCADGNRVHFIDTGSWKETHSIQASVRWWRCLDGRSAVSYDGERYTVWHVPSMTQVRTMDAPGLRDPVFSPDGRWIAASGHDHVEVREVRR